MQLDAELTLALFEALYTESHFHNYANKNVPISWSVLNDGIKQDHNSLGVLQQQVNADGSSRGWGDYKQAMNPKRAMKTFVERALGAKHRGKGAHKVAQEVQRSFFGDGRNYRKHEQQANWLIERLETSC